eukprot:5799167-Amphidinium_carterae.1
MPVPIGTQAQGSRQKSQLSQSPNQESAIKIKIAKDQLETFNKHFASKDQHKTDPDLPNR